MRRCHLAAGRLHEAEQAFLKAKDEDICPLRMLESMHEALAEVARAYRVPLVDARALFREHTPDGILGNELLLDHVHPTISGHQLIAQALLGELVHMGLARPQPGWEGRRQEAYRKHLGSLDTPYFARAKERLEGQRRWTEGRARRLAKPVRP